MQKLLIIVFAKLHAIKYFATFTLLKICIYFLYKKKTQSILPLESKGSLQKSTPLNFDGGNQ